MSKIQWEKPKVTVEQVLDHNGSVPVYNKSDFVIQDGVLVEYTGNGGDILIPPKVSKIGKNAFEGCMTLTSVVFPPTVKKIGSYAFYGCRNLVKIKFSSELKRIGEWAFCECGCLTDIEFPSGLFRINIGDNSFGGTMLEKENQENFVIRGGHLMKPESVNHLGEIFSENLKILCLWRYVFLQCFHPIVKKYLESYNPKTLAVIRFLAHFHLLGSRIQVKYTGNSRNVVIPNGVVEIDAIAFSDSKTITSVVFSNSVEKIRGYAFDNCLNLKSVIMTAHVRWISDCAFFRCNNLKV